MKFFATQVDPKMEDEAKLCKKQLNKIEPITCPTFRKETKYKKK